VNETGKEAINFNVFPNMFCQIEKRDRRRSLMCQATIYRRGNGEVEILRDVISLERTEEGWIAQSLFGESKRFQGRIERIDFLKHTITMIQELP